MMNKTNNVRPATGTSINSKYSTVRSPKSASTAVGTSSRNSSSSSSTTPPPTTSSLLSSILSSGKAASPSTGISSPHASVTRPSSTLSSSSPSVITNPNKPVGSIGRGNIRTNEAGTNGSKGNSSSSNSSSRSSNRIDNNYHNNNKGTKLLLVPSGTTVLGTSDSHESVGTYVIPSETTSSPSTLFDVSLNDVHVNPSDNPFSSPSLLDAAASMANILSYDPVTAVLGPSSSLSVSSSHYHSSNKRSPPNTHGVSPSPSSSSSSSSSVFSPSKKSSLTPLPPSSALSPTDSILHILSSSPSLPNSQTVRLLEESLQKTKEENDTLRHELMAEKKIAGATVTNYDQQIRLLQQEMEILRNDSLSTVNKVSHMHEHSELVHLQEQLKSERLSTHATKRTLSQKTHEFETQMHNLKKQYEYDIHHQQEENKKVRHLLANEKQARTDAANQYKEEKHKLLKELESLRKVGIDKDTRITQLQIQMATSEEKRKNEYNLHESKLADMYRRFTAKETECNEKIQLILNLNENILELRKEIEDNKVQHTQTLATVQQEKEKLKLQHQEELNTVRNQIDTVKKNHQEEIAKLHENHSATVLSIVDKHTQVSSQLQDEHNKFKLQAKETEDQLLTKFTKEMEDLVHLHEQSLHQSKQTNESSLHSLKNDLERIIETLEKEKKELTLKYTVLENELVDEKQNVKESEERETKLKVILQQTEDKYNNLAIANQSTVQIQNELTEARSQIQQLEATVKELQPMQQLNKTQAVNMERKVAEFTDQLRTKDTEIEALHTLQVERTKSLNDIKAERDTLKHSLAIAEANAQGKPTDINELIDTIRNESRDTINKLTNQVQEDQVKIEKIRKTTETEKKLLEEDYQRRMDTITKEWEEKYTDTVEEWERKYSLLSKHLHGTETENRTLIEQKEAECNQRIATALAQATEHVQSQITNLETEKHSLQVKVSHLEGDLATKITELEGQTHTSSELATQVDHLLGNVNKLTLQNSTAHTEMENLHKEIDKLHKAVRTLEDSSNQEKLALEKQLEEASASLDVSRGTNRDEKYKLEQANHEIHHLREKMAALERIFQEEKTELQSDHAKELTVAQTASREEISKRDEEIALLRETLASTTKAVETARESNHALSSDLNTVKASFATLKVEFDTQVVPLQAMKESAQARATALSEELYACENKLATMTITKEEFAKNLHDLQDNLKEKETMITQMEEAHSATKLRAETAETLVEDTKNQVTEGLARIAELERTLELTKNEARMMEIRLQQENKDAEERSESRLHQFETEAAAKVVHLQQENYLKMEQLRTELTNTIEQLQSELTITMNRLKAQRQVNAETEERKMFFQQQAETERRQRSIENTIHAEELRNTQHELGIEKEKRTKADELHASLSAECSRLRSLLGTEHKLKEKLETTLHELKEQSGKEIKRLEDGVKEAEGKLGSLQQQLHIARGATIGGSTTMNIQSPIVKLSIPSNLHSTSHGLTAVSPLPEERIRHQAEINGEDLIQACMRNDPVSVREILHRAHVNVNGIFDPGYGEASKHRTPLDWSVLGRHTDITELLLRKGANLDTSNGNTTNTPTSTTAHYSQELSLLGKACRLGDENIVKLLLNAGAPVNEYQQHHNPYRNNGSISVDTKVSTGVLAIHPPLLEAVEAGHFEIVQRLIEWGADMEVRDIHGHTAFLLASSLGHIGTVKYLLSMQCDTASVNLRNEGGLYLACTGGHLEVVKVLVDQGLPLTSMNQQGKTILHTLCENGHVHILQYLSTLTGTTKSKSSLLYGIVDMNTRDDEGFTALMYAAKQGHYDVLKVLVETVKTFTAEVSSSTSSLQLETRDTDGRTALLLAAEFQRIKVFEYLLSIGCDPQVKDNFGTTLPLIICQHGNAKLLETLIHFSQTTYNKKSMVSFIEGKDSTGSTPLMEACWKGDETCVRLLLQANVSVHTTDKSLETCLGTAAYAGHLAIVQCLLDAEAHVNVRNQFSLTPLVRACERGHEDIALLLLQHGADIHYHETVENTTGNEKNKDNETTIVVAGASPNRKIKKITDYARDRQMERVLRYIEDHNL